MQGLVFKESSHRYRMDGRHVTGVTTILGGGIPKPALVRWAPKVVAEWVANPQNAVELNSLLVGDPERAVRFLKALPTKERDAAAERGTEVHDLAENLILTGEVDAPDDLLGYIEGYLAFLEEWQITPVLAENIAGNRKHWYSGKFDLIATSPFLAGGKPVMIDLKTSKGVYGETALQCAAYAKCEFYMDGEKEIPFPELAATFVAHVTPMDREGINARYEGKPLGTSLYKLAGTPEQIDEHFEMFLHAKATFDATKARDTLISEPLSISHVQDVAA